MLLLLLIWWMYGGYAWLTNAAPPVTPVRRAFLLVGMVGMVGNFTMALAIPHAYTTNRVVFAVGYLIVAAVALILVGALVGGSALVVLWVAALLAEPMLRRLARERACAASTRGCPGHFVERHGLMLLIVLGESVLAIGVGVGSGETAIGVGQVVFAAAGLHHALEHPTDPLDLRYAALLAGGVGLTSAGLEAFRRAVERPGAGMRVVGGVVLVEATWLGPLSGFAELLASSPGR